MEERIEGRKGFIPWPVALTWVCEQKGELSGSRGIWTKNHRDEFGTIDSNRHKNGLAEREANLSGKVNFPPTIFLTREKLNFVIILLSPVDFSATRMIKIVDALPCEIGGGGPGRLFFTKQS